MENLEMEKQEDQHGAGQSPARASFVGQDTKSAANRVVNVGELLELILPHLPFKNILLSQRVCNLWRQTVLLAPKLQQALFLRPRLAKYAWLQDNSHYEQEDSSAYGEIDYDNMTTPGRGFLRKVPLSYTLSAQQISTGHFSIKQSGYLHPLYEHVCAYSMADYAGAEQNQTVVLLRRNKFNGGFLPSNRHGEASWKKMFWCQPPVDGCCINWSSDKKAYHSGLYDGKQIVSANLSAGNMHVHSFKGEPDAVSPRLGGSQDKPVTIGEIVAMMRDWSFDAHSPPEAGWAQLFTNEMYFPTKKEVAKGIVWDEVDDWYYKPLARKGVLG